MRNSRLYLLYNYLRCVGVLAFGTVVIAFLFSILYAVGHSNSGHAQKRIVEGVMWPWWGLVLVAAIGMLEVSERRKKLPPPDYSRGPRLLVGVIGAVMVASITYWWWLEGMLFAISPHTRFVALFNWSELARVAMFAVGALLALLVLPRSPSETPTNQPHKLQGTEWRMRVPVRKHVATYVAAMAITRMVAIGLLAVAVLSYKGVVDLGSWDSLPLNQVALAAGVIVGIISLSLYDG